MKYFEPLFEKFTKRVIGCPSCQKKIRFPIRPGKTLRVTCPLCHCMFDVSFKNPFLSSGKLNLFIQKRKQNLLNLRRSKKYYLILFATLMIGIYIANALFSKKDAEKQVQPSIEKNNKIFEEL